MSGDDHLVILDVDDHAVFRRGMRMLLESSDPTVRVLEAGSLEEALERSNEHRVSVVLLELAVCGENCAETVARIVDHLGTPVLVFSKYAYDDRIIPALQAGACGYANETEDVEVFVDTLRRAAAGEYILDATLVKRVVQTMRVLATQPAAGDGSEVERLTVRESEILSLVCDGRTNGQIGLSLGIAESTVKNHLQTLFRKLHVCSRSQAASEAIERGLLRGRPNRSGR